MPASALIIDDHPLYRDALSQLLGAMLGESSVKCASCGEEALKLASQMPDLRLVLMDFNLPGISGTEAIEVLLSRFPYVDVVAVSASEDRLDATSALRAGAKLFISKAVDTDVMAEAIRRTIAGDHPTQQQWITPTGAGVLEADESSPLTPRQPVRLRPATGRSGRPAGQEAAPYGWPAARSGGHARGGDRR